MTSDQPDWQEPGAHPVAPGVHRIPLPLPDAGLRAVNTYVIENDGGVVLIDPGQVMPETTERLREGLGALGYRFEDVRMCLITHMHRDHYSNAIALRQLVGCRVGVGEAERPAVEAVRDPEYGRLERQVRMLPLCDAGWLADGVADVNADDGVPPGIWEPADDWLVDGATIRLASRTLRVIQTPGHTVGHVVYLDADAGLLFTGDHVLPHITPSIGFEPVPAEHPLGDFLSSLRMLRGIPDARLLPAHGPVTSSVHQRVDELLVHHAQRLELTAEQVFVGSTTVYAIAEGMTWTRRRRKLDELDPHNRMLAVLETKAHLDLLAANERIERRVVDGHFRYVPVGEAPSQN